MQVLKRLVGKTVLVTAVAVGMTAAIAGTSTSSASCPSGHFICAQKSSWFSKSLKCCPETHNCCPAETCLDIRGQVIRRISESCMLPPTPCPSC